MPWLMELWVSIAKRLLQPPKCEAYKALLLHSTATLNKKTWNLRTPAKKSWRRLLHAPSRKMGVLKVWPPIRDLYLLPPPFLHGEPASVGRRDIGSGMPKLSMFRHVACLRSGRHFEITTFVYVLSAMLIQPNLTRSVNVI